MTAGVDELLTAFALRQVAERYAVAVDRRDGELFAAQFTKAGVLEAPLGRFEGRRALQAIPGTMAARYLKTFHAVLNLVPEIAGGTARAETYCIARHFFRDAGGAFLCYEMTIRYQDAFERTGEGWLLSRRKLILDAAHTFAVEDRARSLDPRGRAG